MDNEVEPFAMEFDGELIVEQGDQLRCEAKNVFILTRTLVEFVKAKHPLGMKILIGMEIKGNNYCYAWKDEHFTHIGCLKEQTEEFNKKYIKLIKHLNSSKHVNS